MGQALRDCVFTGVNMSKSPSIRCHMEFVIVMTAPASRDRIAGAGFEVMASTPEQFAGFIKSETTRWGKVIRDAGLKAE